MFSRLTARVALAVLALVVIGFALFFTRTGNPLGKETADGDMYTEAVQVPLDLREELVAETVSAPAPDYLITLQNAADWMRENNPNPQVGSVGGEWAVVALARAGVDDDDWFERYLLSLDAALAGEGGRVERMTDYARVTLALTALGLDASNYSGHDLTAALRTFIPHEDRPGYNRTVNADIFALIALDSRPFDGDREAYIAAILAAEAPSGGWGLSTGPTPDITAMAIQALAPYYARDADVRAAIDRALLLLGDQPMPDAEGNAQMIVAHTALGRDATHYVEALLTFREVETGAFMRVGDPNMMATEQVAYALVAHDRFVRGVSRLYDMAGGN